MSTILKALRRLEEERTLDQAHDLQQHVVRGPVEQGSSSSGFKLLAIVAGGLASAAAGGLVFALWGASSIDGAPAVAAAPATSVPAPVLAASPNANPAPASRPAAPARVTAPEPVAVEVVEGLAGWTDGGEANVPAVSTARPAAEPDVVAKLAPVPPRDEEERIEFAEDVAIVTRGAPPTPSFADAKAREIEPGSALSVAVAEPLPSIRRAKLVNLEVVQTVWHPSSSRREAVLRVPGRDELVRVAEGDAIGTMVLLEIQPAGVVFDHEGVQIQRRVGDRGVGN